MELTGVEFSEAVEAAAGSWLPARRPVEEALKERHSVHPSGKIILLKEVGGRGEGGRHGRLGRRACRRGDGLPECGVRVTPGLHEVGGALGDPEAHRAVGLLGCWACGVVIRPLGPIGHPSL